MEFHLQLSCLLGYGACLPPHCAQVDTEGTETLSPQNLGIILDWFICCLQPTSRRNVVRITMGGGGSVINDTSHFFV